MFTLWFVQFAYSTWDFNVNLEYHVCMKTTAGIFMATPPTVGDRGIMFIGPPSDRFSSIVC